MKRIIVMAGAVAAIAAPNAFAADEPTGQDRENAARECRTERGVTDASREAFRVKYGTNASKSNAFGKCVSKQARDEAAERRSSRTNAPKLCDEERGDTEETQAAFRAKYGTGKHGANAFGKCVSAKAKELQAKADAEDREAALARRSAAKACDEERGETAESQAAFSSKYGTNANKANAFGKCVSKKAAES